jgi:hypothetical protein
MECFHGIVSFGHSLGGTLSVEGKPVDFGGGRGYIEKDWGTAFPAGYVWLNSNHIDTDPRACLIASVAIIPWLKASFRGFIVGLRREGEQVATVGVAADVPAVVDGAVTVDDRRVAIEFEVAHAR